MNKLYQKTIAKFLQLPVIFTLCIFLPAGTLDYWEGWVFCAVYTSCTVATTVYLAIKDPQLLQRRMNVGPAAEKEKSQKVIMSFMMVTFLALFVLPGLDRRFEWSDMSASFIIFGDLLVILGFVVVHFVMRQNTFSAATIEIAENQKVISTGLYGLVRHPMYAGALVMILGIPFALGSWVSLLLIIPTTMGIVWRLLDEEKFLKKNLPGYVEYTQKVTKRLVPFIW